jgi:hypothetical protein
MAITDHASQLPGAGTLAPDVNESELSAHVRVVLGVTEAMRADLDRAGNEWSG